MRIQTTILSKESKAASEASGIDQEKEFILKAVCSDSQPDSHYHTVNAKLLAKYETALKSDKIPLIAHHDLKQPLGKSIDGSMQGEKVVGSFRVPRDWNYGVDTNEFIKGVESGALDSVSVGAKIREARCSLKDCGKHAFISRTAESIGDKCFEHLPGRVYKGETALWDLVDGYIFEVSSVTSGSNPNAKMIDSTKCMAEEADFMKGFEIGGDGMDLLMPFIDDVSEILKSAYDPNKKVFFLPEFKSDDVSEGGLTVELKDAITIQLGKASAFIDELPEDPGKAVAKIVSVAKDAVAKNATLQSEVENYKSMADGYQTFKDDRIEKALKEGVRAKGDKFDKDKWEKILKAHDDISLIEEQLSEWTEQASDALGDPEGRQSSDEKDVKKKKQTDNDDESVYGDDYTAYL